MHASLAQLKNHYMPVTRPGATAPAFYELLLRSHDTEALFRPDVFVAGLCDDTLKALYRIQLDAAARDLPEEGVLAVNLEDRHRECLLPVLLERRGLLSLDPGRVIIELTTIPTRHTIRTLKYFGFRVALDDLGREAFPLDLLCEEGLELIKLDKSMVVNLHRSAHASLLRGLLALFASLGKETVVEGIETSEQLKLASEFGASYLQGYLIGRPAPHIQPVRSVQQPA